MYKVEYKISQCENGFILNVHNVYSEPSSFCYPTLIECLDKIKELDK